MTDFEDFDELNKLITENKGLLAVTMEQLRDAHGTSRLGKYVVEAISNELAKRGISHYPSELPSYQHRCVRVFKNGTPVERLINAITEINNSDGMDKNIENDKYIREILDSEARTTLNKVRELVCS